MYLDRSIAFYDAVLGLTLQEQGGSQAHRWAFLGPGDEPVLTLWQQACGPSTSTAGLHHLSFEVATIADVDAITPLVVRHGGAIEYGGVVPHGDGEESGGLFFTDPDGIRLEVYANSGADRVAAPVPGEPTCGFFA